MLRQMTTIRWSFAIALLMVTMASAADLSGDIAIEGRWFPNDALDTRQQDQGFAVAVEPEFYHDWSDGDERFVAVPYVRWDLDDDDRTHVDLRELYWRRSFSSADLYVGVRKVFWGVTESVHLVDIINQTDLVENGDGEDKLGQPMVQLTLLRDWGIVDLYLMTGFRPRTFAGAKGRLRAPLPIARHEQYESKADRWNPDIAAHWSHILGDVDIGIGHFYGTSREPRLAFDVEDTGARLVPNYDLLSQTSLELQYVRGDGLYKLEAIHRDGFDGRSSAVVSGLEYTLVGILSSAADLGIVAEAQYDNREAPFAPVADRDVAIGGRLTLNDVQGTQLLAFTAIDTDTGTRFATIEGSRRLRSSAEIRVEARFFSNVDKQDLLYALRRDDYLQVEVVTFF
ncbi:MAG: hypothetical protein HOM68_02260 [Gemmatimonadetes bacterium]|nr:hypothetical protein [Gemmatimonadota bacterium]MBT4610330.1 hypothetical protein [Gemmatimonadota bacterium]MBT5055339.1 hypothetical protein [Gemmatimonadota bacterium]MBT5142792.1 hypothetical protein [Gemmatimonadota bacterium]MBT5587497.1 hypothetical protein [Gemmatimonadota bacterium]